jgi:hypothetical protein
VFHLAEIEILKDIPRCAIHRFHDQRRDPRPRVHALAIVGLTINARTNEDEVRVGVFRGAVLAHTFPGR